MATNKKPAKMANRGVIASVTRKSAVVQQRTPDGNWTAFAATTGRRLGFAATIEAATAQARTKGYTVS